MPAGRSVTFTYKNPAGTVVATGTYDSGSMKHGDRARAAR